MMTQQAPSPQTHAGNSPEKTHDKVDNFLMVCVNAIAWVTMVIFWLTLIGIFISTIINGIMLEVLVSVVVIFLLFYLLEETGVMDQPDWTIDKWAESANVVKRTIFLVFNITIIIFAVFLAIGFIFVFLGVLISFIINAEILTIVIVLAGTPMIVLLLEKIIPVLDRFIMPRNVAEISDTDEN